MNKEEVQEMINQSIAKSIKSHELRVGWISGLIGSLFVFGIMHSIWLIKESIQ
jgi:ABC-type nickel/cobalt efflux system permease component RcnA